jgi:hypothetical protein
MVFQSLRDPTIYGRLGPRDGLLAEADRTRKGARSDTEIYARSGKANSALNFGKAYKAGGAVLRGGGDISGRHGSPPYHDKMSEG